MSVRIFGKSLSAALLLAIYFTANPVMASSVVFAETSGVVVAHKPDGTKNLARLKVARKDIIRRAKAHEQARFSYNMDIVASGTETYQVSVAYDPEKPLDEQWEILSPTRDQNEQVYDETLKQIKNDQKKEGEKGDDQELIVAEFPGDDLSIFSYSKQEAGYLIYTFDPAQTDLMDDDDGEGNDKIARHLDGELALDSATGQLSWIRIYAKKPFKPVAVAKLKKFELLLRFAPAWSEGPIVMASQKINVAGSAMFQKFEENTDITFTNIAQKPALTKF